MPKKEKLYGASGFDTYYENLFGERWKALRDSLFLEPAYMEWNAGGAKGYFLDTGSVLAALTLPLKGAKRILDLCAAPGGKTLVVASRMDQDAFLISNDRSRERKQRLVRVCDECLDPGVRSRVTVTCSDGAKWCTRQTACFDRILLDAPCSSERHVLTDRKYLDEWSPGRIRTITIEQWALLSSAYRMLVPGGYLLYATCALVPEENDEMIARIFRKFDSAEDGFKTCTIPALRDVQSHFFTGTSASGVSTPGVEKTLYGYHILPDRQHGAGPLYFSLVHKTGSIG